MRFPLEVVKEVQEVIAEYADRPFILGYRISPEEPQPESYKIKDIYPLIDELIKLEVDYLHASLVNVLESKPIDATEGKTISELIVEYVNERVSCDCSRRCKTTKECSHRHKNRFDNGCYRSGFSYQSELG